VSPGGMTQATGKRRGHGEDSIYWDEPKSRYVGAVSLGFSASGTRLRKKVSGRTKTEVRDKLRELHQQVDSGLRPAPRAMGTVSEPDRAGTQLGLARAPRPSRVPN
jgi:hypothetical protein